MRRPGGVRRKIWIVFVLQLAAITFATLVGVYGAATIVEDLLIRQALKGRGGDTISGAYATIRLPKCPIPTT